MAEEGAIPRTRAYVVQQNQGEDTLATVENGRRRHLPWLIALLLRLQCYHVDIARDGSQKRTTRCRAMQEFFFFSMDHLLRFAFWLLLNYRYGLPLWFAVVASFLTMNLVLVRMYYHLRKAVRSAAFTEMMMDEETRALSVSITQTWYVVLIGLWAFLLPTTYWQTFRRFQAGELEGPVWLQWLWLISYPYFLVVGFGLQMPTAMMLAICSARRSGTIIRKTLPQMKEVLLRAAATAGDHEDAVTLKELSDINRAATDCLHPYQTVSHILRIFSMCGFATVVVMILAILIPEHTETTILLGICNGIIIGLLMFVGCLYLAAQQSVIFQKEMTAFHDCRLMTVYVRLFGNRSEFVKWLRETDMAATKILGVKVTTALFAKLASIAVSFSGTIVYITARRST